MREIKFRVWDKQSKVWVGKSSHDWVGTGIGNVGSYDEQPWKCMSFEGRIMSNDNMGGFVDSNQEIYVIQQYTGLKDKNGKEIYEGDIVSIEYQGEFNGKISFWKNFEVKWDYNGWNIGNRGWTVGREIYTVIGNIFENPELLK